jgi:hypothetical protein
MIFRDSTGPCRVVYAGARHMSIETVTAATLVQLQEIGVRGNTHFPFADLNNLEIADLMENFLTKKRSD